MANAVVARVKHGRNFRGAVMSVTVSVRPERDVRVYYHWRGQLVLLLELPAEEARRLGQELESRADDAQRLSARDRSEG